MMRVKLKKMMALMLCAALMMSLSACSSSSSDIKKTLSNFETACREVDTDGILDCVDPGIADPIRTGGTLLSAFGVDTDSLATTIASFVFGADYSDSAFLQSIQMDVGEITVSEDKESATAECTISFELFEEEYEQSATVSLIHVEDDDEEGWYISGIQIH